jgi:hypothetical protein
MSRPPVDLPERLLTADATDFERRVIEAALQKKPSRAASARMASALGVTMSISGTTAAAKTVATNAASNATAGAGAATTWPWVSLGVIGLVVGAVVGVRTWNASRPQPTPTALALLAPPRPPDSPRGAIPRVGQIAEPVPSPVAAVHRGHVAIATGDLRDEISFVDAARTATSSGDGRHALEILGRYRDKYPYGSFRPEATAIRIEALMKLGRASEARALATRFVAENRGSLLAGRVAELVGLTLD